LQGCGVKGELCGGGLGRRDEGGGRRGGGGRREEGWRREAAGGSVQISGVQVMGERKKGAKSGNAGAK
jgi:hypothetical protein